MFILSTSIRLTLLEVFSDVEMVLGQFGNLGRELFCRFAFKKLNYSAKVARLLVK